MGAGAEALVILCQPHRPPHILLAALPDALLLLPTRMVEGTLRLAAAPPPPTPRARAGLQGGSLWVPVAATRVGVGQLALWRVWLTCVP